MASCCNWNQSCNVCVDQSRYWFTVKELPGKFCCCSQPSDTGMTIADWADGITIPCPPAVIEGGIGVGWIITMVLGFLLIIIGGFIAVGYKRGWRFRLSTRQDREPLLTRYQNDSVYSAEMVELAL